MPGSPSNADPILPPTRSSGVRIVRVDAACRLEAVERLVARPGAGGRSHAERFLEFSEANGIALEAMFARLDESGRIEATALAVPNPGRTAILFLTRTRHRHEVEAQAALIAHATEAEARDVDLVQVLLEPGEHLQREAFLAAGFQELAHLHYLERPLPQPSAVQVVEWPAGVELKPYEDSRRQDVLEILEASYERTLDCPGLRGLRRTEDILAGHQATGQFDPELWTLLYIGSRPCGVLMLNPAPASNTIELVYTGLAPHARGQGLGRRLLRHGLRQLAGRGGRAVTLAVDERNAPAIALYRGEGFRRVLRRVALISTSRRMESAEHAEGP